MMKNIVIALGVVIVIMLVALFTIDPVSSPENEIANESVEVQTFTYVCSSGADVTLTGRPNSDQVTLAAGGETYELTRVPSASGLRYANENSTVVYREFEGEVQVEIDNEIAYRDCSNPDIEEGSLDDTSATLTCPDGENIQIAYSGGENQTATLLLPDVTYELREAPTGSGIRYVNDDENVEYRESDGEATIIIDGEIVYENCEVTPDEENVEPGEVEQNIPENDLQAQTWEWQETRYDDGEIVEVQNPREFALTFDENGRFSALTDCNNVSGNYELDTDTGELVFSELVSTRMACSGDSQEQAFVEMLGMVESYIIDADGSLALSFDSPEGTMFFEAQE